MNILYVWDADYPWDVRAEKICTTLHAEGCGIHIAARNLRRSPQDEVIGGLHVHRLRPRGGKRTNYAASFPAFFNPVWSEFLDTTIRAQDIGLVIVRDLPLAIAGIRAGQRHGIPVIFDMAEDYVAMLRDVWKARKFRGFNLVVRNPYLGRIIEKYVLNNVAHILVVVDESKERLLKDGVPPSRLTIVGNTPPLHAFNNEAPTSDSTLDAVSRRYSAVYAGGIQLGRGIQTVLAAMPEIVRAVPNFLFVVAGDGYAVGQLKAMVEQQGLEEHVMWLGWVDHHRMFDLLKACKLGIVPHLVTDHVNTTIPNKVFDYMGAGLPVVASDAIPLKRILEEEKCGLTFRSGDASDLARAVIGLQSSDSEFGRNGRAAVQAKYNWSRDAARLLSAVERVVAAQSVQRDSGSLCD